MVTLTVRQGEVVCLTSQMIKKMTWLQHAKVWKVRRSRQTPAERLESNIQGLILTC